jgi:hypothetical protein
MSENWKRVAPPSRTEGRRARTRLARLLERSDPFFKDLGYRDLKALIDSVAVAPPRFELPVSGQAIHDQSTKMLLALGAEARPDCCGADDDHTWTPVGVLEIPDRSRLLFELGLERGIYQVMLGCTRCRELKWGDKARERPATATLTSWNRTFPFLDSVDAPLREES